MMRFFLLLIITGLVGAIGFDIVVSPPGSSTTGKLIRGLSAIGSASPPSTVEDTNPGPGIVQSIQTAGELTTLTARIERVTPVEEHSQVPIIGTVTNARLLFIAVGLVRYGVRLNEVQPADVQVNGRSIKVNLPAVTILDVALDAQASRVYDQEKSLWFPPSGQKDLLEEAEALSLKQIRSGACASQMINAAEKSAAQTIQALIQATAPGYEVTVESKPNAECLQPKPTN